MKLINIRRHFATFAFAAILTTGCMAVAYAQSTADPADAEANCPFADTENGSCRTESTADQTQNTEEAAAAEAPEKVVICHRPGTPAQQTLFVSSRALSAHMDHADTPGPCGE